MLDQFARVKDRYWFTRFDIEAPVSLRKGEDLTVLTVIGSFSRNKWVVQLGLNQAAHAQTAQYMALPIAFDPDGPLAAPGGKETFTNDEVASFVRDVCHQLDTETQGRGKEKFSAFQEYARVCGWEKPNPPAPASPSACSPRQTLG